MKLTFSVVLLVIQGFALNMCLQANFSPTTVTVCEGDQEIISCPDGKVLRISSAWYGRKDATTCPHESIQTTNCKARCGPTKRKVKCWCNGLTSCNLQANNGQFGDPCVGTYKYLQVEYRCVTPRPRKLRAVVCEGNTQTIGCPVGDVIKILKAWYGRKKSCRCPHSQISDTNCTIQGMTQVRGWCDGETTCDLQSNNGVFTDPCVGTYKYLQVRYRCKPDIRRVVVCEGHNQIIDCPSGTEIKILKAWYGRRNELTCPHSATSDTNCKITGKPVVKGWCDGQSSCNLQANNGVFTDPCFGTYKYLSVRYQCKPGTSIRVCFFENIS